jgi:hypothetical protein
MKFLPVLIIFLSTTSIYAQKFGVAAGLNIANMHMDEDDWGYETTSKIGFHVGPTIELPINQSFSFASGVLLSNKGFKYKETINFSGIPIHMEGNLNLYYLDIPLAMKGYVQTRNMQFYGLLGPYCAIGLSGKMKASISALGQSESGTEKVVWGNGFERVELGATAGAGVAFDAINFGVTYNYGLTNSVQNRVFAVSMGYKFGQN